MQYILPHSAVPAVRLPPAPRSLQALQWEQALRLAKALCWTESLRWNQIPEQEKALRWAEALRRAALHFHWAVLMFAPRFAQPLAPMFPHRMYHFFQYSDCISKNIAGYDTCNQSHNKCNANQSHPHSVFHCHWPP